MTTDIKELVQRLRDPYRVGRGNFDVMVAEAAAALEAMAGEVEALKERNVKMRAFLAETSTEAENRLRAESDRLKAALVEIRDRHIPDQPAAVNRSREEWAVTCHTSLRIIARKALGGDA